jgi:hypothetical protein
MVAVIVLSTERLQAERSDHEVSRWSKTSWDEWTIVGHRAHTQTSRAIAVTLLPAIVTRSTRIAAG